MRGQMMFAVLRYRLLGRAITVRPPLSRGYQQMCNVIYRLSKPTPQDVPTRDDDTVSLFDLPLLDSITVRR